MVDRSMVRSAKPLWSMPPPESKSNWVGQAMLFDTVVSFMSIAPPLIAAIPPPWNAAMFPVITSFRRVRTLRVRMPPPSVLLGLGAWVGQLLALVRPSVRPLMILNWFSVSPTAPLWTSKTRSVRLPSITVPLVAEPAPLIVMVPTSLKMLRSPLASLSLPVGPIVSL